MKEAEEFYNSLPEEVRNEYEERYTKTQFIVGYNALSKVADTIVPIVENIKNLVKAMCEFAKKIIDLYPNKRVVHLASHGKKARTRKKNIHRIGKWLNREVNVC